MVTFFTIPGSLVSYSRGLLSGISSASSPMASALEANGNKGDLRRVLLKGARFGWMVFFPIGISFLIRGRSFIGLWMGPSYAALSGEVLMILTLAQLIAAGNYTSGSMTLGIGRHKGMVPAVLLEGLCNLSLSIALVRTHGIAGVAVGTALPSLATQLVFWPWYIRRVYGSGRSLMLSPRGSAPDLPRYHLPSALSLFKYGGQPQTFFCSFFRLLCYCR